MHNTYFDNGATSFPKAAGVADAMARYLDDLGGSYGRSAHGRALEVSRTVEECRERIAVMIHAADADRVVFCHNATHAINSVIAGLDLDNSSVLVSVLEHNSVMRPLAALAGAGRINIEMLPALPDGRVDVDALCQENYPDAGLVIISHMSNVNGVIQPIKDIKKKLPSVPLLVDAAQSAGHVPIDVQKNSIDFLALTGHKGLLGPTGTGALYCAPGQEIRPFLYGGTGSNSESFDMPTILPDHLEAGTPNIAGIFGLNRALEGAAEARHSPDDFNDLVDAISSMPGIITYRAQDAARQGMLFSFVPVERDLALFARDLNKHYGIETRTGLHCSPAAHRFLGTTPGGTIRISPSITHTVDDFAWLIESVRKTLHV